MKINNINSNTNFNNALIKKGINIHNTMNDNKNINNTNFRRDNSHTNNVNNDIHNRTHSIKMINIKR
jgi:hypothetical protein